ncbi:MAG: CtpF protein [Alphaproteobacteria bacterium]|nr:CtpF protein [Alphaproteobacteria bacterium]MDE2013274.1 CtpF protein [Alphaproteobacteria bacterium]MDE2074420.1 CtpF protein [Alphaproteobacteria bacterium]MDE2350741.1 CtpF protein [Alphaproteobacteria bacterium]
MAKSHKEPNDSDEGFGAAPHERPVPRISIHAFCEFPDTGAALERAAGDRRLTKAHMAIQLGGVQGAVEHFTGQTTPNLLIVETRQQGQAALDEIERLAEVCDPETKVIIIGRVNDVELYRELIRRGVSEYLVAPISPLRVIEVISGLYLAPDAAPIGRVVSFIAARGGAGSSTLAHNAAWSIAEWLKINTTIVDMDLPFGTLSLDFNEEPGQGVADALAAPERLDDVLLDRLLQKAGDHLSLFSAPAALERDYDAEPAAYEAVIDAVRQVTPCVILDLPHLWAPWVRQTLHASDEVVIVAAPDLASLRNAKSLADLLKQNRPNDAAPKLVLNQVGIPKRPEIPLKDFAETVGLQPSLVIPFDPALFGAAANNGQMLTEVQPRSQTAEGVHKLAELLTGRAPQGEIKGVLPFFSFLKGKKRA